jgi:hypothetical protein
MAKLNSFQLGSLAGLSGTIKYNSQGEAMNTKVMVSHWSQVLSLSTKLGERKGYLIIEPQELPLNIKQLIFDDFYPVALSAFNQNKSLQFERDVWKHLFEVDGLILVFHDGVEYATDRHCVEKGIAFRTFTMFDSPLGECMYIEGTAVDPNYQSYGFYQALTRATTNGSKFVCSRTQNPVVITALNSVFGNVAPITASPDEDYRAVARTLAKKLKMKTYDEMTMTATGVYGKSLNGLPPKIDNEIKNRMYAQINPDEGDAVVAVCRV